MVSGRAEPIHRPRGRVELFRIVAMILLPLLAAGCTTVPVSEADSPLPVPADPSKSSATSASRPSRASSTSASPSRPLAGRTVVVDPGHNGIWTTALNRQVPAGNGRTKPCNSSGTAAEGYPEHAFNWAVAGVLVRRLRDLGATVVLTRDNDRGSGPCVNIRARITNEANPDALVSLHADGNLNRGARGYHIIVSSTMIGGDAIERRSRALAVALRSSLDEHTKLPRSTYIGGGTAIHDRTDIAGLNLIRVPGVMLELGNMRNRQDLALQRSPEFRESLAKAITEGVVDWLS